MIDKIASRTSDWIANSKGAQKFFNKISDNASQSSVRASNLVNFILRPVTIMGTTKSKNILDGAYCASSSIASGITETVTSKVLLNPFNKAVEKSTSQLNDSGFFQSIAKEAGSSSEKAQSLCNSALGRLALICLVPVNGALKMLIHPPLSHKVKNIKESIDKKGKLDVTG